MITIQNTLVNRELIEEHFVCNLSKCKGACCVEGDSGAPLAESELKKIEEVFEQVKPYLNKKGLAAIEKQGKYVTDFEGDYTTTCVDGNKECAYVVFEEGITQCAFEQAYNAGKTGFKKPISCHLYPVRITQYPEFDVLNYDRWHICSPACSLGKELKVPVYEFLKEALIRKYGAAWYNELDEQVKSMRV